VDWLDYLTIAIILVVAGLTVYLLLWLAGLPGRAARQRGHPQADAINVLGWLSLLTLFATWPVALVWAYARPARVTVAPDAAPTTPQGGPKP
jgi:hypothetical protein